MEGRSICSVKHVKRPVDYLSARMQAGAKQLPCLIPPRLAKPCRKHSDERDLRPFSLRPAGLSNGRRCLLSHVGCSNLRTASCSWKSEVSTQAQTVYIWITIARRLPRSCRSISATRQFRVGNEVLNSFILVFPPKPWCIIHRSWLTMKEWLLLAIITVCMMLWQDVLQEAETSKTLSLQSIRSIGSILTWWFSVSSHRLIFIVVLKHLQGLQNNWCPSASTGLMFFAILKSVSFGWYHLSIPENSWYEFLSEEHQSPGCLCLIGSPHDR